MATGPLGANDDEAYNFNDIAILGTWGGDSTSPSPPCKRPEEHSAVPAVSVALPPIMVPEPEETAESTKGPGQQPANSQQTVHSSVNESTQTRHFSVTEPVLQGSNIMDKYYDYLVEVKDQSQRPIATFRRRYNHFEWLRSALCQGRPDLIIPPLPGKSLVAVGPNKLEVRRAALEVFLNRVNAQPLLAARHEMQEFVSGDPGSFSLKTNGLRLFEAHKSAKGCPPEYAEALADAEQLDQTLTALDKHNQRLSKLRYDMAEEHALVCQSLEGMEQALPDLATTVYSVRRAMEMAIELEQQLILKDACTMEAQLRELAGYAQAVMDMLRYRASVQRKVDHVETQQSKANTDLDALHNGQNKMYLGQLMGKDLTALKEEKIALLKIRLDQLAQQRKEAEAECVAVNATVDQELEWWKSFKQAEIARIGSIHIQQHLDYIRKKEKALRTAW